MEGPLPSLNGSEVWALEGFGLGLRVSSFRVFEKRDLRDYVWDALFAETAASSWFSCAKHSTWRFMVLLSQFSLYLCPTYDPLKCPNRVRATV